MERQLVYKSECIKEVLELLNSMSITGINTANTLMQIVNILQNSPSDFEQCVEELETK